MMTIDSLKYHKILPTGHYKVFTERPKIDIARVKQIHSTDLISLKGMEDPSEKECDGMIFNLRGLNRAIAITTADCMPILFLSKEKGAFLHAGWRGLAKAIHLQEKIKEMTPHYCLIGPSIKHRSFEVQPDFKEHFDDDEFFHKRDDKLYFDLAGKAQKDILAAYPGISLEVVEECTFEEAKYHSYRRDHTKQRNWNIFHL